MMIPTIGDPMSNENDPKPTISAISSASTTAIPTTETTRKSKKVRTCRDHQAELEG